MAPPFSHYTSHSNPTPLNQLKAEPAESSPTIKSHASLGITNFYDSARDSSWREKAYQPRINMQQGPPGRGAGQAERSARSVFVGNISYDASEAQLRQLFSQVGAVLSFRLMVDHDTGRPKGYGFCEFAEPAAVEKAIRALNGHELHGRSLRVDSASGGGGDRDHRGGGVGGGGGDRDERDALQVGVPGMGTNGHAAGGDHPQQTPPAQESAYGPEPEMGKAPEAIAKTVASMPPERMYELMRQMKETVNNNPQMARHLLMENPQLAYALLQAQVIMRVVDPKVAYQMLHREQPATLAPFHQMPEAGGQPPVVGGTGPSMSMPPPGAMGRPMVMPPPQGQAQPFPFFGNPPPPMGTVMPAGFQGFPPTHMPPPGSQPAAAPVGQRHDTASSTGGGISEDDEQQQAAMLVKVLQLTDEQIRLLPPEDRAKVIELRNQLRAQVPT